MFDILGTPSGSVSDGQYDIAYKWVVTLFSSAEMGVSLQVFTSMLTLLGGLFVGWHVIIGIVHSAYSGKVLGERFHQIWAPLRVVVGFGLLVPVADGFSSVHYILKEVVGRAAVNMGNAPIVAFINHVAEKSTSVSPVSMAGRELVYTVLEREVCAVVVSAVYGNTIGAKLSSVFSDQWKVSPPTKPVLTEKISPYQVNSNIYTSTWNYDICGSFSFTLNESDLNLDSITLNPAQSTNDIGNKFFQLRNAATQDLINTVRSSIKPVPLGEYVASKSYAKMSSGDIVRDLEKAGVLDGTIGDKLKKAATDWNKSIEVAARDVYTRQLEDNSKKLKDRIDKYGFMMAGSYERDISKISGLTSTLANASPKRFAPSVGSSYEEPFYVAYKIIREAGSGGSDASGNVAMTNDGDSMMNSVLELLPVIGVNTAGEDVNNSSGDPVGRMINRGHNFLASATALIALMASAHMISEATAGVPILGGVVGGAAKGLISYLSQWISYLIGILLVVGILHSFVLPMIPMIMVFIMGVSWLVMMLEAAIAGVLWAFVFIRMDGQEFIDRNQSAGAGLLFNLFLRPALGMLAFIGGLILLPLILRDLEVIWSQAFNAQTASTSAISTMFGLAANIIIFWWMQWTLTLRIFGLIPQIADHISGWMGFNNSSYNDSNETHTATSALIASGMAMSRAPLTPGAGATDEGSGSKRRNSRSRTVLKKK